MSSRKKSAKVGAVAIALAAALTVGGGIATPANALNVTTSLRTCNAPKTVLGYSSLTGSHNHRENGNGAWWGHHRSGSGPQYSYGPFLRATIWFTVEGTPAYSASCA